MAPVALLENIAQIQKVFVFRDHTELLANDDLWLISSSDFSYFCHFNYVEMAEVKLQGTVPYWCWFKF